MRIASSFSSVLNSVSLPTTLAANVSALRWSFLKTKNLFACCKKKARIMRMIMSIRVPARKGTESRSKIPKNAKTRNRGRRRKARNNVATTNPPIILQTLRISCLN